MPCANVWVNPEGLALMFDGSAGYAGYSAVVVRLLGDTPSKNCFESVETNARCS